MLTPRELPSEGLDRVRQNWVSFLILGICLICLGTTALSCAALTTLASVMFIGSLLIAGGILQAVHALRRRNSPGFFIDVLGGVLYIVVGFMLVANPAEGATALTLIIAVGLLIGGATRIVAALAVRNENWVWVLVHGVISLLLGIAIWRRWPLSGLLAIGVYVGIDLLMSGWSFVTLVLIARRVRPQAVVSP